MEIFIEKCQKYDETVEVKGVSVGEESRILDTVVKALNLIQKQDKIIDKMAEQLNKFHSLRGLDEDCFIPREYSDINDCIKKQSCKECIIEYFKKEVEKE